MNILITICARGGSKGIPGKNIRPLNGIPLINYTINTALKFAKNHTAIIGLSTDSPQIIEAAATSGLNTKYVRPAHLATDEVGKLPVIQDLLNHHEMDGNIVFDYVLDLDITSPLRTLSDLNQAFEILQSDKDALNIFSVNPAARNPYFNMVEKKGNGYYGVVKEGEFLTRQSAPKVFDMNASFYFYRKEFFSTGNTSALTEKSLIYIMPHACFDLDEPIDFEFMSYLIENKKLNFDL